MHRFTGRRGAAANRQRSTQARPTGRPVITKSQLEDRLLQAQKMEAIGLLASGLAHDFNNTLMVAGGYADLIRAEAASPEIRAYSEAIAAVVGRGSELTRQLLAFARPTEPTNRPVDVGAVVTGIMPLIRHLVGPEVEVEVEVQERPMIVRCDACQLEQALMNLAINARDAMSVGGRLTVAVRAGRARTGDRTPSRVSSSSAFGDDIPTGRVPTARVRRFVEIEVRDSGCGIATEHIDRIFEPFFTTKPAGIGSGLGLPMVRRFAAHAGGDVSVESARGVGTTVTVRLPRAGAAVRPAPPVGREPLLPVNRGRQPEPRGSTDLVRPTSRV